MNKFISAIILILLCLGSFAQELQWERVYQKGFSHEILDFRLLQGEDFIVLQDYLPDDYRSKVKTYFLLDSLDVNDYFYAVSTDYYRITETQAGEKEFVTLGVENSGYGCYWCSLGNPYEWVFSKNNLNNNECLFSNQLWEYELLYEELENWPVGEWGNFLKPIGYFELGDSIMIISHENGFARIAYNGEEQMINAYDLGIHSVSLKGLFQLNDTTGLAFSQDGVYHMNELGELEFVAALSYSIDTIFQSNEQGYFICQTGDSLRYIDELGTIINELNPTDYFDSVFQFDIKASGYQGLGMIDNAIHLKENINSNDVLDFIPDTSKFHIKRFQFSADNSAFYLLGYESAVDNKHLLMQKFSIEPSDYLKSNLDIALTSIEALNTIAINCKPYYADEWYPGREWPIQYSIIPLRLVVTNLSDTVINSFFINSDYEFQGQEPLYSSSAFCSIYCRDSHFSQIYSDTVSMQPGESKTIYYNVINGTDTITPLPLCIWVTSPNFQPDRNPNNDKVCLQIQVGFEELEVNFEALMIYPNPTNDRLSIQTSEGELINTIEIFDYLGKSVLRQNESNTIQTIDVSTLSAGLYLINLFEKSGKVYSRKFIVTNKY